MAKHAFLLLSDPANPGKFANPLTYAAQLDDAADRAQHHQPEHDSADDGERTGVAGDDLEDAREFVEIPQADDADGQDADDDALQTDQPAEEAEQRFRKFVDYGHGRIPPPVGCCR